MAIFSLVPLLVTNYVGYTTSRRNLRQTSLQSVETAARLAAARTQLFLEKKRDLVSSLVAGNRDLLRPTRRLVDGADGSRPRRQLARHLSAKVEEADHATVFWVLSPQGRPLASSSETPDRRAGDSGPCRALTGPGLQTGLVRRSDETRLVVRHPLVGAGLDRPAQFCGLFEFAVVGAYGRLASRESTDAAYRLLDADGRLLASYRSGIDAAREHLSGSIRRTVATGGRWLGRFDAADGRSHFGAVAPIRGTDLSVVASLPEAEVMATLQRLRNRALMLGAAFAAFVMAGIGYTVRWFVGPISELLDAIREMKRGALDQTVQPSGPKDIAVLTSHFNAMSSRVAELQGDLERRVRERTASLRRSRAFNELLVDSVDDNLLVVDEHGRVEKANRAARETYGNPLEEQQYEAVVDVDRTDDPSPVARAFETGEPVRAERVHRSDDGPEIMDVRAVPLPTAHDVADTSRTVMVLARPVTEQKRRQAQLVHSEKMAAYGLLASGVAHEIGNPLASIKAQVQRARMSDGDCVDETLEVVESEVDRIESLLRQLSGLARRQEQTTHRVSLNRVVEDALQLLRHDPGSRNVDFEVDLDPSAPAVHGGEDRLVQVLLNLGMNATDAVDGGGRVAIETERDDGSVRVRVHDDGPGVAEAIRDEIFEPHFTTKPAGEGTGLGLYVSSRIVDELSGTLRYVETDRSGATFEVVLPAVDDE